ncbi:hypothetical protein BH09ACT12_BH09ACT12_25520 [soil metagenome]
MNTPDDQNIDDRENGSWESEMGDEFERRVRDLQEAPFDFSSVKGTAMKIRNKRRAAVAGGILAAAAVIVPVAIIATTGSNDRAETIDPAVPSETATDPSVPSPSPAPSSAPAPTPGTLPDSAALGFDYLEIGSGNAIFHEADGTNIELPGKDYSDATDLGGQIAALRYDSPNGQFVDLIEDGQFVTTYDVRTDLAIAPDGRTVAFITTDDELLFVNGDRGEQSFGKIDPGVSLSAIIGNGDCVLEVGCHPFLEYQDYTKGDAFEINYENGNTAPAPGARGVNDAADGFLVSVLTEATDTGTCGGLYDREGGGSWVFQTCAAQVLDISPTGEYVVGTDPYGDGVGPGYFSIPDGTTGDEPARHETNPGFVYADFAWLDDTHAIAVVNDDGAWQIVSLGVDNSSEVLVGPIEGDESEGPFLITGGDPS